MRVIVTGSRDWTDYLTIWSILDELHREYGDALVIVHGAHHDGADWHADAWAFRNNVKRDRWPVARSEWRTLGPAAGPLRNERMVNAGADFCLAFINQCNKTKCAGTRPHGSHGATNCATLAHKAGIKTTVYHRSRS